MPSRLHPHHEVQFVVPHESPEEHTVAVVQAQVAKDNLKDKATFLEVLIHALSRWAQTTKSGQDAWKPTAQDFNVGDLSHYQDDPSLKRCCRTVGIHDLSVTPYVDISTSWMYDRILIEIEPDL